ncbi:MAG: hypothetical protein OEU54_13120 [Gemmatimonadota bacterium]|nr:hypothetical protein [Gemmatimonadota bacterium]
MLPEPLHPAIVHFPLVLAVLAPVAVVIALWSIRRGGAARPIWMIVIGLLLLLAGTSRLAIQTGEAEEDRVESVVTHDALEDHEEGGERLFILSAIVLVMSLVGLVSGRLGDVARPLVLAATIAIVVAALRVGESGGELVYVHGAASAYSGDGVPAAYEEADKEAEDH